MATTKATNLGHRTDVTLKGTTTTIETDVVVSDTTTINNAGSDVGLKINSESTGHIMQLQDDGTDVMVVADGGNVGIGTSSITPAYSGYNQVNINGSNGATLQFQKSGTTYGNIVNDSNAMYLQNSTAIAFGVGGTGTGTERMRIDSNGKLSITESAQGIQIGPDVAAYTITRDSGGLLNFNATQATFNGYIFDTADGERMRIDSSGNVLVGYTSGYVGDSSTTSGIRLDSTGFFDLAKSGSYVMRINRQSTDGDIISFRKDGSAVGSIGTNGGYTYIGTTDVNVRFHDGADAILPASSGGSSRDNAIDLGSSGARFDDIYATNGTIQTSDRNEKQNIQEISEAEKRVAVVAKGLLRKFRWKSAVEKKGDDARIHFGIIAQDLKSAFEAEGLDAGRYAMFINSEWWETQTEVPAVEAQDAVYETQTDEEGNEVQVLVSEAVEAKEAYTRTETYDTEEEAPDGAIKKDRMGVRYSELLAFIISAI